MLSVVVSWCVVLYSQFKDGLVRLCTEEYVAPTAENLGARCVHLTNYAVNKRNSVSWATQS